jgi:hypothetical protein
MTQPTPTIDVERLTEHPIKAELQRLISNQKTTAHMSSDERHEFVVREFPDGLTSVQFAALTLLSAGEDGVVDPPSVGDFFQRQSLIFSLWIVEGLIERKCKRDEAGPYYLTKRSIELLGKLRSLTVTEVLKP